MRPGHPLAVTDPGASSPEEASKLAVRAEFDLLVGQADVFGWTARLEDRGDYYVIYVRLQKPGGRCFVLRLECDDYPRQAPLAQFVDPDGWLVDARKDIVDASYFPRGGSYLGDRGIGYPVMCIRGHRDFYAGGWHGGWTNLPHRDDRISQFVGHVSHAISNIWS